LLNRFVDFFGRLDSETTRVAIHVNKLGAGLGYQGLIITGRSLVDFSPEVVNERKQDTFFTTCPHCSYQHLCKVALDQRGIDMECTQCLLSYGVLAADNRGQFRYVNEFLTGYEPPAFFSYGSDVLHEMYTVWGAVAKHCAYTKDGGKLNNKRDAWQTALETQTTMRGDCEDSSVFLADWLLARGHQVRVALGHFGDMGGHAWVICRVDGVDYLLESTEAPPSADKPPYVSDVGARYVPDTLFDRDAIYVRAKPKERFGGDYWSTKAWIKVQPRVHQEKLLAEKAVGSLKAANDPNNPRPIKAKASPIVGYDSPKGKRRASQPSTSLEAFKSLKPNQTVWQIPLQEAAAFPPTPSTSAKP
jgi:hypothetical protein